MRVVALLATYNERRFIGACIEHLRAHGIETYLIDNGSTDETVEIAERYLGDGLIAIEQLPREDELFSLYRQLLRKEELARTIEADWFIHLDADEIRLPPPGAGTLAEALAEVDAAGYNVVNFLEFSFIPTRESPDHDHADFQRTLRTYYPLLPEFPHRLNAWRATEDFDLTGKGGHRVLFRGLHLYPESFSMKHFVFLSVDHAVEKYVERRFDPGELRRGWHGWRDELTAGDIRLPGEADLRISRADEDLDASMSRKRHWLVEPWAAAA